MLHSCGQTEYQLNTTTTNTNKYSIDNNIDYYIPSSISSTSIQLYTAYLGKVTIDASIIGDSVLLEKYHTVNNKQILVKVINAIVNNLSNENQYKLGYLKSLTSYKINIKDNKYYYILTLLCVKKIAQLNNDIDKLIYTEKVIDPFMETDEMYKIKIEYPSLCSENPTKSLTKYKQLYQEFTKYNSPVDIFFNTIN